MFFDFVLALAFNHYPCQRFGSRITQEQPTSLIERGFNLARRVSNCRDLGKWLFDLDLYVNEYLRKRLKAFREFVKRLSCFRHCPEHAERRNQPIAGKAYAGKYDVT